ncbi:outer membrane protein transport protein [Jejuia pallidilutea]|uniref:Putative outer membrane protein n=1 Tax=Jejuia pallidilutea TaxID=504487 RepID=A0A090WMM9_9FLAO|nr:outer membrane protein transport protein [Jejuia pallidilutea]GAL68707.1 putative outer membrane protein [Jejuia pallidilutea]GAL73069.1 putative outer membrane protein [Jejuia pallidilutea]GAL90294.1 putative outer membrane protein [Jejuia pallidilutea]
MIKKLVVVFVAIFTLTSYAQEGTASPYSFYGIGSLKFKGTVENRSMGGLSIYRDSIHMNLRNPASFTGPNLLMFNNESRPVKYTVGGSYSSTNLKSDSGTANVSSTTFDYLALNFPVGKFGVALGLMPYTAVGYKLETENDEGFTTNRFNGEGGLNKAFLGVAYSITDNLSVGVNAQYNFGNIQNSAIEFRFDNDGNRLFAQSKENNRSDLSGLNFDFGVYYISKLNNSLELTTALTFTPKANITSQNQRSFSTVNVGNSGQESVTNTIEVDLEAQGLLETDLVLPSSFSFGAGLGQPRKWFVGAEYESQNTSTFENVLYQTSATNYEDGSRFSLGGFFIPEYNSFNSYFKRLVYRAGLRVEKTGLNIENESINEFGISFGVGIPVGDFGSNANLGLEIGRRGTTNNNLIQENFINFQISLSLNDRWFQKRKYD